MLANFIRTLDQLRFCQRVGPLNCKVLQSLALIQFRVEFADDEVELFVTALEILALDSLHVEKRKPRSHLLFMRLRWLFTLQQDFLLWAGHRAQLLILESLDDGIFEAIEIVKIVTTLAFVHFVVKHALKERGCISLSNKSLSNLLQDFSCLFIVYSTVFWWEGLAYFLMS